VEGKMELEKFEMPEIIESNNFRLEKININRVEELFKTVDNNREYIMPFLGWVPYVNEVQDSADFIDRELEKWSENKAFVYMIIDNESNKLAGLVDVHNVKLKNKSAEFGYWLSKNHSKKGFMTNSVKAMEEVLFSKGFHRLVIRAVDTNMNSRNVAIRLGYKEEGILRDNEYLYDRFVNQVLYSKLSTD
jgi:RimJ/RimL family protein N-acetyltransferase